VNTTTTNPITSKQIDQIKVYINITLPLAGMTGDVDEKFAEFMRRFLPTKNLNELTEEQTAEVLEFLSDKEPKWLAKYIEDTIMPLPDAPMIDYALWAVRLQGWYIAPLKPMSKSPATAHGVLDAANDEQLVRAWWNENPDYNYMIALGPSNLVVWDYDKIAPFADMPATCRVRTGRDSEVGGGIQDYYTGSASTKSLRADHKYKLLLLIQRLGCGTQMAPS
jgi:hypothetical protein